MRLRTAFVCATSAAAMQHRTQLFLNSSASPHVSDIRCRVGNNVGSWGAVEQPDGSLNLCIDDKLVPELYVIGAPKCATTSIYYDLANAGVQCAGDKKEFSFWSTRIDEFVQDSKPVETEWLASMPSCSTEKGRQVVGDFSPGALGLGLRGQDAVSLPSVLSSLYGVANSKRITFVTMLREPLSRIHSQWYMTSDSNLVASSTQVMVSDVESASGPVMSSTGVFNADLDSWLQDPYSSEDTRVGFKYMAALISSSRYGEQLEAWLGVFPASQFVVVPYHAYTERGSGIEVCEQLSARMNFKMECKADVAHTFASSSKNPPLDEDVPQLMRTRFRRHLRPDKTKLVSLLATGIVEGMSLPRYTHIATGNRESYVQQWLDKWW